MPGKENPLFAKVKKLREELAAAEKELESDFARRRTEIDEEMKEAGLAPVEMRRRTGRVTTCKVCGQSGHNARRHAGEKAGEKADKKAKKKDAVA